jgi:cytoskeleton protein RodZ
MTSLGETLRRERLRLNLDYETISQELKIAPRMLQAIEEEHLDKLPGGVFVKGFVRQYARMLGVNEEEAVAAAQKLLQPGDAPSFAMEAAPKADPRFEPRPAVKPVPLEVARMEGWEAVSDRKRSSTLIALALVVGVMLICSVVYGWWLRHPAAKVPSPVAAASPVTQPPEPVPAAQTSDSTASAGATAPAAAETDSKPAAETPVSTAADPSTPAVPPPTPLGAAASVPANPETPGPVHVEMTAIEPVWITARADGKYAFSGVINPPETKTLDASGTAELRIGNAGGVRILLNGKPIGDIGPRGQVRTVQFTSGGFHIVVAPPKPPDPIGLL